MKYSPSRWLPFEDGIRAIQEELEDLLRRQSEQDVDLSAEITALQDRLEEEKRRIASELTPWRKVLVARHPNRPYTLDYIAHIFDDFAELHGDRRYGDDQSLVGGPAMLGDHSVMVIGHQKGRTTKERQERNFPRGVPQGPAAARDG